MFWGESALYLADISNVDGTFSIKNVKEFQPGDRKQKNFYESCGFSPDGKTLLFAANLSDKQLPFYTDICTYDLKTKAVKKLTSSSRVWDRYARFSPDGKKIIYASSRELSFSKFGSETTWKNYLRSDVWIMDSNGGSKKRLTFFNEPSSSLMYQKRACFVSHLAWSPDGKKILVTVNFASRNQIPESKVYVLDLAVAGKNK